MSAFSITQRAVADAGSQMQNVQQTVNLQPYLEVYFHMEVAEVGTPNDEFTDFNFVTSEMPVLEPGKQYRVTVWTELNGRPGQRSVRVDSDLDLILTLMQDKAVIYEVTVTDPQIQLLEDNARQFRHEFELIVADEFPNTEAHLLLWCRPNQSGQKYRQAASQLVKLSGTINQFVTINLGYHSIAVAASLLPQTAFIHVERVGEKIKLSLINSTVGNISTIPFTPPDVRLADFIEAETRPEIVLGDIRCFSDDTANIRIEFEDPRRRTSHTILGLIHILYQRLGRDLQLVIYDHTDTEIPWEMLELETGVFLGSVVPIARWLPIPLGARGHKTLAISSETCSGRIVAYIDAEELSDTTVERKMLASFTTEFHPNLAHLYDKLKQPLTHVGLVYLGCHGMFVPQNIDMVAYGSQNNPGNRLIPLLLENLDGSDQDRPILFINACHSGRVIRRKEEYRLHGLPVVMLKRIGAGLIGTLGPVGSTYASDIAEHILRAILEQPEGVQPAQLLRQLRAMAAQQLISNRESRENQLRFIYTFMYVYYGNPQVLLRLLPAPVKEDRGE